MVVLNVPRFTADKINTRHPATRKTPIVSAPKMRILWARPASWLPPADTWTMLLDVTDEKSATTIPRIPAATRAQREQLRITTPLAHFIRMRALPKRLIVSRGESTRLKTPHARPHFAVPPAASRQDNQEFQTMENRALCQSLNTFVIHNDHYRKTITTHCLSSWSVWSLEWK